MQLSLAANLVVVYIRVLLLLLSVVLFNSSHRETRAYSHIRHQEEEEEEEEKSYAEFQTICSTILVERRQQRGAKNGTKHGSTIHEIEI